MNIIYLQPYNSSVKEFVVGNRPLQKISEEHCVLFVDTAGDGEDLSTYYSNVAIVSSDGNVPLQKLCRAIEYLQKVEFDIVVRTCPDTIIANNGLLLDIIDREMDIEESQLMGRWVKATSCQQDKWGIEGWIRGAGQIMTKKLIDKISVDWIEKNGENRSNDFSLMLGIDQISASVDIINEKLLEKGESYSGEKPIWHSPKFKLNKRLECFNNVINVS